MLDRTVRELRGEAVATEIEAQLNLGLNIRIPPEYIPEENQRLRIYKRVAEAEDEARLADVREELQDRYGAPPPQVQNLMDYAVLKLLCQRIGVTAVERKRDLVTVKFTTDAAVEPERLARLVAAQAGSQFTPAGVLKFFIQSTQPQEILARLRQLLEELAGEVEHAGNVITS